MAYGLSNGHVSKVGYPSDSLAACVTLCANFNNMIITKNKIVD